ncbi:hypothetical protein PC116_g2484 [Phytophthora cactorum]|nr:hypothetical protein PC116_g2484 [Phytophthora cactorum]
MRFLLIAELSGATTGARTRCWSRSRLSNIERIQPKAAACARGNPDVHTQGGSG